MRSPSHASPPESLEDLKVRGEWALDGMRSIIAEMRQHAARVNRDHDFAEEVLDFSASPRKPARRRKA